MKKFFSIMLVAVFAFVLTACGGGNDSSTPPATGTGNIDSVTLTLAHASHEDTITGLMALHFAEQVEELSGGAMKVDVFPNSQLGGDSEILTNLGQRQIDFVVANTAPWVGTVPSLAVFDTPNVFASEQVARQVFEDAQFMDIIRGEYADQGFKLLGFADQSYRVMSSNVRVEQLSDLNGVLVRTLQNPYHIAYWNALGASPTPMPFSEVFVALQQGTVAAQENPIELIVASSFYEVQDYVILTNHLLHIISLVTNSEAFEAMTPEQQAVIEEAAALTIPWARQTSDDRIDARIALLEENGVEVIEMSEAFRQEILGAIEGVNADIRSTVGDEIYNALRAAVERAE